MVKIQSATALSDKIAYVHCGSMVPMYVCMYIK